MDTRSFFFKEAKNTHWSLTGCICFACLSIWFFKAREKEGVSLWRIWEELAEGKLWSEYTLWRKIILSKRSLLAPGSWKYNSTCSFAFLLYILLWDVKSPEVYSIICELIFCFFSSPHMEIPVGYAPLTEMGIHCASVWIWFCFVLCLTVPGVYSCATSRLCQSLLLSTDFYVC